MRIERRMCECRSCTTVATCFMSSKEFPEFGMSNASKQVELMRPPNPAVNTDAPVHVFNSANRCGGAPVTLFGWATLAPGTQIGTVQFLQAVLPVVSCGLWSRMCGLGLCAWHVVRKAASWRVSRFSALGTSSSCGRHTRRAGSACPAGAHYVARQRAQVRRWPNAAVNADVPGTIVLLSSRCGGTPVTLYC